jgi:hypothetical protein
MMLITRVFDYLQGFFAICPFFTHRQKISNISMLCEVLTIPASYALPGDSYSLKRQIRESSCEQLAENRAFLCLFLFFAHETP